MHVARSFRRICLSVALPILLHSPVSAGPAIAPPLPPPSGSVVNVSTEAELQQAVRTLTSNTTILLAPGTYRLTGTLHVNGSLQNVALRGASGNRDDVVLLGPGMTDPEGSVPNGIWSGGGVQGLLVANLTVRGFPFHCIILNAGTERPWLYNLRLADAGQQIVKSNPDGAGGGVDDGIVEYSIVEYATTSRDFYTNGVDVLGGRNWIIRHNLFRNIRAPQGQLAGPALLMWRGSANTTAEGNTFINCQRAIAYGLEPASPPDHAGGVIRNNFIHRRPNEPGDAGIIVFGSPDTLVAHNTILLSGTYGAAIEYRFTQTTGVRIVNNLTDAGIVRRDGAQGVVESNSTSATPALFVDPDNGDLHLRPTATAAIDAGVTVASVTVDWDGDPRTTGPRPDLGADEFQSTTSEPPAPPTNLRIVP
jgi:hypothetical protein